jgi:hypothetical protein
MATTSVPGAAMLKSPWWWDFSTLEFAAACVIADAKVSSDGLTIAGRGQPHKAARRRDRPSRYQPRLRRSLRMRARWAASSQCAAHMPLMTDLLCDRAAGDVQ